MATFLDFAPHKKTIAWRSTKVTFDRSSATFPVSVFSADRAFSSSGTYSPVNCPHKRTLRDLGPSRIVVIFNTIYVPLMTALHPASAGICSCDLFGTSRAIIHQLLLDDCAPPRLDSVVSASVRRNHQGEADV